MQIIASIGLISLVLLQQGKGADAGASFGGGSASQTFFGSGGSGNFLTRTTAIFAMIFFATSLGLAYFAKNTSDGLEFLNDKGELTTKSEQASKNMGDLPAFEESSKKSSGASALPEFKEKSQGVNQKQELNNENDIKEINPEIDGIDVEPAGNTSIPSKDTTLESSDNTSNN